MIVEIATKGRASQDSLDQLVLSQGFREIVLMLSESQLAAN
jgi:hypothetical protein